jgi:hypothetical protein
MTQKYLCRDCGTKIRFKGGEILNGKMLAFDTDNNKKDLTYIFKCNSCFEKDPSLTNYQETEVYSRVVGYLRPVKQWNVGKKAEYGERKNFKVD